MMVESNLFLIFFPRESATTTTHLMVPLSAGGGTSLTLSMGDRSGSDDDRGVKVDGDVRAVMSAATDPVEMCSWVELLW